MAENDLKNLSKDYASGKITTDEYREKRKRLLDNITKVENPTPVNLSPVNKREFSKGPIYILLWILGLVGAISILIIALKMGEPKQSPQATIAPTQATVNLVPISPLVNSSALGESNNNTPEDPPVSIKEKGIDTHNGNITIISPITKKIVIETPHPSEKLGKEILSEFNRNKEICDKNWLTPQDAKKYTLQLCIYNNEDKAQRLMEDYADLDLKAVIFEDEGPLWIIYGIFDTYDQAKKHSKKLADNLQSSINANEVIMEISSLPGNVD